MPGVRALPGRGFAPRPAENVEPVTARTFPEFSRLRHRTAGMYWNSPRLRAAYFRENTPWRLTLYRWRRFGDLAEIFGVDFEGEFDGEARTALLAQSLAEARRTRKIVNSFAQNP